MEILPRSLASVHSFVMYSYFPLSCTCMQFCVTLCLSVCVCSMASTVVQLYLKQVLEAFYHEHSQVRITALNVVQLILRQGLVHPVQVSSSFTTEPDQLRRYG